MIRINDPDDGHLVASAAGTTFNPAVDHVIANVTSTGNILGGVIYTGYTGASIGMHVAAFDSRWRTRELLWVAFDYPFNQLGVRAIFGTLPSDNHKALDFDRRLGFKELTRIPDVFPDADMVVMRMLRDECRWLKLKPPVGCKEAA